MDRLSQVLWRERELLETLAYKLDIERLELATGRTRWLVNVIREIEALLEDLRATAVLRATAADEAAETVGMSPNPSLAALADACDQPWRSILLDHRETMINLAREIAETSDDARARTAAGAWVQRIEQSDLTAATTVDLKLREVVFRASLAARSRVKLPSLLDFLR